MMKCVYMEWPGKLVFGEQPKPVLGDDKIMVKVDCAVINPSDILVTKGLFMQERIQNYPFGPGNEGAGTVCEVGKALAEKIPVGMRVGFIRGADFSQGGSWSEYIVVDMTGIIPLKEETSLDDGAMLFVNPMSVLCMVDRAKQLGAKAVVITAAASQLGRMLVKTCHKEGIVPICTVRRQEQADLLKAECKAEHIVNSSDPEYLKKLAEVIQAQGATVCFECIGGNVVSEMLSVMGMGAVIIVYGWLSEEPIGGINPLALLSKGQAIEGFFLGISMMKLAMTDQAKLMGFVGQAQEQDFKSEVNKRFGLHQIHEAIKYYQENQTSGKVHLRPDLTE